MADDVLLKKEYRQCSISVMDTVSDPGISFDEKGICNYYYDYLEAESLYVPKREIAESQLLKIIHDIKHAGSGKKYDCIMGVSGGVDSTYMALQAKKLGLKPLLVHFDNGWNSELAVKNIQNIIDKLGFDLYTLVVDWSEFKDLQLSYLKASVVDIEAITDHAIVGTIYRLAAKYNVKYILSGNNIVSEHVLPSHWIFNKADAINIKDIHRHFGKISLNTYPFFTIRERMYYEVSKGIKTVPILNYMPYNGAVAKQEITSSLGWRDYGGKHYESIFTRFYQGYILPVKFGIDKRKAHLSNLIFSKQISKAQALEELSRPIYDPAQCKEDKDFVLKKLGLSELEFDQLMQQPRREHKEYKYTRGLMQTYPFLKIVRPIWRLIKKRKK